VGAFVKFAINLDISRFDESRSTEQVLADAFELAQMADEAGVEMLFVAEHHTLEFALGPNPFVLLSSWAARLENIRMGPAVIAVPYWHPIRLAEESALFDQLSQGRLELGLGRGAYQYEMDRMLPSLDPDRARSMLGDAIPLVRRLWSGGDVSGDGTAWTFPASSAVPRPLQTPVPPMWVAARHPDSFRFAVENHCNVMANPLAQPFAEVESLVERFQTACAAVEDDTWRPRLMILRNGAVYDDPAQWRVPVDDLHRFARHFRALFDGDSAVKNGFVSPIDLETVQNQADYLPEQIKENHIFGTPDEVVEKLRGYEALGIDYYLYAMTPGTDPAFAKRSLELLITEVMPHFEEKA
jgi:alkanesulfonate monooxygenase SsuD/methylene tetrahydromethanopterin reductase-like flavin-dependent oxidoreductase (luciferase family)